MPRWLYLMLIADPKTGWRTVIQSFLALTIAGIYALIRLALFGDNGTGTLIEPLLVLGGSVVLSGIIMKKLTKKK